MMDGPLALLASLIVLGLFLAGCGDSSDSANAGSLTRVPWTLSAGVDVSGWEQSRPTATFANGTVAGSDGCNYYSGRYTVDGSRIVIALDTMTQMYCLPPRNDVARRYVAALEKVAQWSIADDELTLANTDGDEVLRYGVPSSDGA